MISQGKKMDEIHFVESMEIVVDEGESIELPFRYVVDENNQPILAKGMIELILEQGF